MKLIVVFMHLLLFPGLLYAAPMAWLMLWLHRKIKARSQNRIGPPFFQPFFDFVKLLAKQPVQRPVFQRAALTSLPVLAIAANLGVLALLPVFPYSTGFSGDLVLLVALIEIAPLCSVLAGFTSCSLYGEIGATREAVMIVSYSLPFLAALAALAAGADTMALKGVALTPLWPVRIPVLAALALCLPVKLGINPFSIANAEQEIYSGSLTEYDGPCLGLWELAHQLEWVALTGLWAALAFPAKNAAAPLRAAVFVALSLALVVALSVGAAATARLKLVQASRVYWKWGFAIAIVAFVAGVLSK